MKISEVRNHIDTYSIDQLKLIVVELYKALPKAVREDTDIDGILSDIGSLTNSKQKTKQKKLPDIELLKKETAEFVNNAYAQNYLIPNRSISKQNRSKWRFTVKRLYKDIVAVSATANYGLETAKLLEELYRLLCYSCEYTLFTAYDSFESAGITQEDFFRSVLALKYQNEDKYSFIKNAILLMINNSLNRYTLYENLIKVILEFTETTDLREMIIAVCSELIDSFSKESPIQKDHQSRHDIWQAEYKRETKINILTIMGFYSYARLFEYSNAVSYFKAHYSEKDREISLYVLLKLLLELHQKDCFLDEYEKALTDGINPRDSLKKAYRFTKNNGELPANL